MIKTLSAILIPLLFFAVTSVSAESLTDSVSSGDLKKIEQSVTVAPQQLTPEQQRFQKLTDTPEKPLDGVKVKVYDVNLSKNSSVKIEYAPEFKQGGVIDNKEQTSIKYDLKF